jgi:hypothetical protein
MNVSDVKSHEINLVSAVRFDAKINSGAIPNLDTSIAGHFKRNAKFSALSQP